MCSPEGSSGAERPALVALLGGTLAFLAARLLLGMILPVLPAAVSRHPAITLPLAYLPLLGFALPVAWWLWLPQIRREGWRSLLGWERGRVPWRHRLSAAVKYALAATVLCALLTGLSARLLRFCGVESLPRTLLQGWSAAWNWLDWVVIAGVSVLVAPLVEELLFRVLAPHACREAGSRHPAFAAALLFALMHGLPQGMLFLTCFGCLLSERFQVGGIRESCLLHALYNLLVILFSVLGASLGLTGW